MDAGHAQDAEEQPAAAGADATLMHTNLLHAVPDMRPALRGWNHLLASPMSLVPTVLIAWHAETTRGIIATLVFGLAVALMFGTSGVYHRLFWAGPWGGVMRRVDHAAIFVTMALIYTSVWVGLLHGRAVPDALLIASWVGASLGVAFKLVWMDAPRWLSAGVYIAFGLTGLFALPAIVATAGWWCVTLLLSAAAMQLVGGLTYAFQRPDPFPTIFGFHEVFHLLVTLSLVIHYYVLFEWVAQ